MAFDPNQPFEIVNQNIPENSGFDPKQPFETVQNNDPGFIENVTADFKRRGEDFGKEISRIVTGDALGKFKGKLPVGIRQQVKSLKIGSRIAGVIFGSASDLIGEGIKSGVNVIDSMLPEGSSKSFKKRFNNSVNSILNQLPGGAEELRNVAAQKGADIGEMIEQFSKDNPEVSRDLEDLGNSAIFLIGGKGVAKVPGKPPKASVLKKTAKVVDSLAKDQRTEFLLKISRPIQTKSETLKNVERSPVNLLGNTKVSVSKRETEIAKSLEDIKGLSPFKAYQANFNILKKATFDMNNKITGLLKKEGAIVKGSVNNKIANAVRKEFELNELLVGQEGIANTLLRQSRKIISRNGKTVAGLHQSRKEFDDLIKSRSKNINPLSADAPANARTVITRLISKTMNKAVDENTAVQTARLRKKHSLMLSALEPLRINASQDGKNLISKAMKRIVNLVPGRNTAINAIALTAGVTNWQATAKFAPLFAKVAIPAAVASGISKLTLTPTTKRMVANLIKQVDIALKATKSKEAIKLLRLDRVALLEFAKGDI